MGRAVRCGVELLLWVEGSGWEEEGGNACFRLAELPGLLMKRSDSIASCSRTLVCGETSMASEMVRGRPDAT